MPTSLRLAKLESNVETSTLSVSAFPPPRLPNSPVLSFASLLGATDAPSVPSLLDAKGVAPMTSGRVALATALKQLGIGAGAKVLLPAYNCRSMVDAVRWTGATPVLYKSRDDLAVDLDDVSARIDRDTRCLVVVNFFGFPQDLTTIRAFCDERGIKLIEDCAHCFFGSFAGRPIGSFGDFAIASPMKFFPIYDGGLLVAGRGSLAGLTLRSGSFAFQVKALLNNLERSFGYSRLRPFNWLMAIPLYLKDRLWAWAKSFKTPLARSGFGPNTSDGSYAFDPAWVGVRMSRVSAVLLRCTSVRRLIERRRRNFETLLREFAGHPGCRPLHRQLGDGVVPYVFPLYVDHPEVVFPRLKMRGVPLFRWEDVDHSVCNVSTRYSQHLFQLPCHQELSASDMRWLVAEVKLALEP